MEGFYASKARNPVQSAVLRTSLINELLPTNIKPTLDKLMVYDKVRSVLDQMRTDCQKVEEQRALGIEAAAGEVSLDLSPIEVDCNSLCSYFGVTELPSLAQQLEGATEVTDGIVADIVLAAALLIGRYADLEIFSCGNLTAIDWLLCSTCMGFRETILPSLEAASVWQQETFKHQPAFFEYSARFAISQDGWVTFLTSYYNDNEASLLDTDAGAILLGPFDQAVKTARQLESKVAQNARTSIPLNVYKSACKVSGRCGTLADRVKLLNSSSLDKRELYTDFLSARAFQTIALESSNYHPSKTKPLGLTFVPNTLLTPGSCAVQLLFTTTRGVWMSIVSSPNSLPTEDVEVDGSEAWSVADGQQSATKQQRSTTATAAKPAPQTKTAPARSSATTTTTTTTVTSVSASKSKAAARHIEDVSTDDGEDRMDDADDAVPVSSGLTEGVVDLNLDEDEPIIPTPKKKVTPVAPPPKKPVKAPVEEVTEDEEDRPSPPPSKPLPSKPVAVPGANKKGGAAAVAPAKPKAQQAPTPPAAKPKAKPAPPPPNDEDEKSAGETGIKAFLLQMRANGGGDTNKPSSSRSAPTKKRKRTVEYDSDGEQIDGDSISDGDADSRDGVNEYIDDGFTDFDDMEEEEEEAPRPKKKFGSLPKDQVRFIKLPHSKQTFLTFAGDRHLAAKRHKRSKNLADPPPNQ